MLLSTKKTAGSFPPEDPMAMLGPAARQQDHEQEGLGSAEKGAACAHEHSSDPTGQADDCTNRPIQCPESQCGSVVWS